MNPIPCAHCGHNFMRITLDPEAPKLCNNCTVREEKRNPIGEKKMETIDILVKCPVNIYADIEEDCINGGTNPSEYLLRLYCDEYKKKDRDQVVHDVHVQLYEKEEVEEMEKKSEKTKNKKNKIVD